ncbi:MAG: efflux transporter outer membrane subunit [Alphaproteobacteria bacterium]|nr:efflux transporter outer membrane subunit [Alphaproteobacteria bacterium]HPF45706.1 efflux transporter outer membrane subunit [Emcibacteraceae bacterium]HRW28744.1 efflux transporter outer membrane subunit [Emcibacteraceae bacterium]
MNTSKIWAMTALTFALSACSSLPVAENELNGIVEINDDWQAFAGQAAPVENGWLDSFAIEPLNQLVRAVLQNNPNYNEVALRMQSAGYTADAASGRLLPRVGANFSASRTGVEMPIENTSNSFSLGLDASWEVDLWGKLSASAANARSNYEVAKYDFYGARLSLAAQVAQAWFDVIEANQQLDLSRSTVKNYERATGIIRDRFEKGLSSGLDLRLSITSLEAAKATEKQRETDHRLAMRRLELFAGRYPAANIDVSGEIPADLDDVPVGVPLDLLERRPDLQSAKARLFAAGYRAQVAEKALLPSISITARGSNTSEEFGDLLKFDNIFWNLVGGITQPIFQGGQLRYAAKAEQLNFEAQKQNYAQTLLRAFKEVEDALDYDRSLAARVEHIEIAAQNAVAAEEVALEQYSQGLITISTLLQSQRSSLTQQSQLLNIKKQRINNRISLYLSLGGDFTTRTISEMQRNETVRMEQNKKGDEENRGISS